MATDETSEEDTRPGGPGTERCNEELMRNQYEPGKAAVSHGAYIGMTGECSLMVCDKCPLQDTCPLAYAREDGRCKAEEEYVSRRTQQIIQAVRADGHEDPSLYESLINSTVLAEIRLARIMRYISVTGPMLPGWEDGFAEGQPILSEIPRLQKEIRDGLKELNLTPAARARLENQKSDKLSGLAAAIIDTEAEVSDDSDE